MLNTWFRKLPHTLGALSLVALGYAALAESRVVEAFDSAAWHQLQSALGRPTAVAFATTDCVHCPAVIEALHREIRQRKRNAALIVVVMDMAPGEADAAILRNTEYRLADRLFAFAGQAPAIRHAVDPRWRGVTPYVSFLTPNRPAVAVTGPPSSADIDAWIRASSGTPVAREKNARRLP